MRIDEREAEDMSNVEDRRGVSDEPQPRRQGIASTASLGVGGTLAVVAIVIVVALVTKSDPKVPATGTRPASTAKMTPTARAAAEAQLKKVAVFSFNNAQRLFADLIGSKYRNATLVLFWDRTESSCGMASAASGPFYCGPDSKAYIDLGFYRELATRFGAPGEFAQAYVIAHEMGHHVQNVLGTTRSVRALQAKDSSQKNPLSVKLELQADCYAGVWGHHAAKKGMVNTADAEKGLRAAAALGDDRLRAMAGKAISPETFTHGSSEDRVRWFRRGMDKGTIAACDTFR